MPFAPTCTSARRCATSAGASSKAAARCCMETSGRRAGCRRRAACGSSRPGMPRPDRPRSTSASSSRTCCSRPAARPDLLGAAAYRRAAPVDVAEVSACVGLEIIRGRLGADPVPGDPRPTGSRPNSTTPPVCCAAAPPWSCRSDRLGASLRARGSRLLGDARCRGVHHRERQRAAGATMPPADGRIATWLDISPAIGDPPRDPGDALALLQAYGSGTLRRARRVGHLRQCPARAWLPGGPGTAAAPGQRAASGVARRRQRPMNARRRPKPPSCSRRHCGKEPLTIVATGPATTIASVLLRQPAMASRIERVILVAGTPVRRDDAGGAGRGRDRRQRRGRRRQPAGAARQPGGPHAGVAEPRHRYRSRRRGPGPPRSRDTDRSS